MCSPDSVKRWRTPSALSIRTRSCAPVAVPMGTPSMSLRVEPAARDRACGPPARALDHRLVRRSGSGAIENRAAAPDGVQRKDEVRELIARVEGHVLRGRAAVSLEGHADHEHVLQDAGAHL